MKKISRYVGLDVHAETIAVAVAEADGDVRSLGTIPNRPEAVQMEAIAPKRVLAITAIATWSGLLCMKSWMNPMGQRSRDTRSRSSASRRSSTSLPLRSCPRRC